MYAKNLYWISPTTVNWSEGQLTTPEWILNALLVCYWITVDTYLKGSYSIDIPRWGHVPTFFLPFACPVSKKGLNPPPTFATLKTFCRKIWF